MRIHHEDSPCPATETHSCTLGHGQGWFVSGTEEHPAVVVTGPWSAEVAEVCAAFPYELVIGWTQGSVVSDLLFLRDARPERLQISVKQPIDWQPLYDVGPELKALSLVSTPDSGAVDFSYLSGLEHLSVHWRAVSGELLELPKIRTLYLKEFTDPSGLQVLSNLRATLQHLTLDVAPNLRSIHVLSEFVSLQRLSILQAKELQDIEAMRAMNLESLRIWDAPQLRDISSLGPLANTLFLDLDNVGDPSEPGNGRDEASAFEYPEELLGWELSGDPFLWPESPFAQYFGSWVPGMWEDAPIWDHE